MIGLAIIGTGGWARRLVGAVQGKSPALRFVAAASSSPEARGDFARDFGLEVARLDDVLARHDVQGVVIASQHSRHLPDARAAAGAGKHILVEKPLAPDLASARAIVAAADAAGVVLAHGFNRRFAPAYQEMQRRIGTGEIGTLLHLEGQFSGPSGYKLGAAAWRAQRAESPAGAMTARGVHALDCMIGLAGPVTSVFCHSDRRVLEVDVDDVTSGLLRFAGGVTGYIASHHATGEIWRLQAYGSKGWLEMRGPAALVAAGLDGAASAVPLEPGDMERAEIEAFARAIGGAAPYPVTAEAALNGIAVLEAMVRSAASGAPVAL